MHLYPQQNRNQLIDVLRGISIIAVILLHINIHMSYLRNTLEALIPHDIYNIIFRSGYYGVMIFFVISGFLITNSIKNKWETLSNINALQFYQIRFARIVPCLLGLLTIISLLHIMNVTGFVIKTTTLKQALVAAFTFHINWLEAKTGYLPANWDVLWSLSIEETFYLFFPIACLLLRKKSLITLMMVLFILLGPIARVYLYSDNDIWSEYAYLSNMDGIAIGCLAALYANKSRARLLLVIGLTTFTFAFFFRNRVSEIGLTKMGLNVTLLELGVACILMITQDYGIRHRITRLISAPISWFGKNSYEIYLTHSFIVILLSQLFSNYQFPIIIMPIFYLFVIVASGLLGQLVATYFSEPLNRYLRNKQATALNMDRYA